MRAKTSKWFEAKLRYDKVHDNGTEKKVTESFVIEAFSFGEAEKIALEFLGSLVSGEVKVININPTKFNEVIFDEEESCDRYYKAKLQFITLDEKTGKEMPKYFYYLVQASSFDNCKDTIRKMKQSTLIDYQIAAVSETKIVDVVEHKL